MKQLFLTIALCFALFGCATAEKNAYVTIGSVGTTANAAIGAYSDYISTHRVPTSQILEVRKAVIAYVQANEAARAAVVAYKSGHDTQSNVDLAISALSAASANLVSLISTVTQSSTNVLVTPLPLPF